jgi:hypothetical protein
MLSVLLFFDTYCKQYALHLQATTIIKFYCDSSSLIKRIDRHRHQSWLNPSNCLASDYNLESAIIEMLDLLPVTVQFIHVKSHQDDNTEIHLLTWDAQMNVHADHLATDYLENYAEPSKIIPFIRPSQASLTINGETITRRFASRLRLTASGPNIERQLKLRNNWTHSTFQSINSKVPGKALTTMENSQKVFVIKFAHGHLPTRRHMNRIGEAESDKCPSCLQCVETDWHILSCPNRSTSRNTILENLNDVLQITRTQPDLTIILLQGVRGTLNDPSYQMNVATREPRFQYLVTAQNKIGWQHILKGRFSHHWLQCQQLHIYLDPDIDSTKNTGERWLKRVLNCLWNSIWQVWLIRNDDLHGRDRQQREQKRIQKLTPQITALYEKADLLLADDKDIFEIPLET